jgi:hypothetical protein
MPTMWIETLRHVAIRLGRPSQWNEFYMLTIEMVFGAPPALQGGSMLGEIESLVRGVLIKNGMD